jgi:dihydroorotate dehydrogenase electron transfer subunit
MARDDGEVLVNEPAAEGVYLMRLDAPRISECCHPFQFIQIQTDPGLYPFLRRPFSVLRADRSAGWLEIVYDVIGPGTRRMSQAGPGSTLGLLGPLGNPFTPPDGSRVLLVGGGVGLVPLAFLAWERPRDRSRMVLLMGAASRARMPELDRLVPHDLDRHLATEDGGLGHRGLVTDLMADHVDPDGTVVLTCGPHPMMARVAELAAELNLPCYASLENHMACGFGACVGCVVECREADREDHRFLRVCIEGPVVDAHSIVW